jgi:hypothetical protein
MSTPNWDEVFKQASENITPFQALKMNTFDLFDGLHSLDYPPEYVYSSALDGVIAAGVNMSGTLGLFFQDWCKERGISLPGLGEQEV